MPTFTPRINSQTATATTLSMGGLRRLLLGLILSFATAVFCLSTSQLEKALGDSNTSNLRTTLTTFRQHSSHRHLSETTTATAGVEVPPPPSRTLPKPTFTVPETNGICPNCLFSAISGSLKCGLRMKRHYQDKKGLSLLEAGEAVAKEYPQQCGACSPSACSDAQKVYRRLDQVAPPEFTGTTHYLSSIDKNHRLPKSALGDLTTYFNHKDNVHPQRQYLFEYNPSIVQLPASQQDSLNDNENGKAVYLASYRVSSMQQCVTGDNELQMIGGSWPRPKAVNYLGLALLRDDLSIVKDVVVDLGQVPRIGNVEDFRLFVLRDQVYVTVFHKILPLWLTPQPDMQNKMVLDNVFASDLTVTVRNYASCAKAPKQAKAHKNLGYFVDEVHNTTVAERFPMGQKLQADLDRKCEYGEPLAEYQCEKAAPLPDVTFHTSEEMHFASVKEYSPSITSDHGGSCCSPITQPQTQKPLLLGVAHSKTRFRTKEDRHNVGGGVAANHFFSTFYAMEATAPYNVVARSGRFCLGFPSEDEAATQNPYARLNMNQLKIGDSYKCPAVHFISGMTTKAGDPSKLILTYGVNDCAPRLVEVNTSDVLQLLFPEQTLGNNNEILVVA